MSDDSALSVMFVILDCSLSVVFCIYCNDFLFFNGTP